MPPPRLVLELDRLAAALAVPHVERELLALLHILLARALQHGGMQEHVLAAVIRA